ncbi:uncharacterized protein LOC127534708 isoform X2 [Acanthochromis polyacanthus]|nr:uncharacterized protein LOC127534708 isoform X2 [Acanthochromis polyacanthus]
MSKYITDLQVSLNETDESQLRAQGFSKMNVDLNKGAGGKNIYIWYKRGDSGAITRIQLSFNDDMSKGLNKAGYQKIPKNLNTGAGGKDLYLWFFKGSSEDHVPIVNLDVSTVHEAQKFKSDHEILACDLNQDAGGSQIFLSVKREKATYISDIAATINWQGTFYYWYNGYTLAWLDTNLLAGGDYIALWYRQTTKPEEAIKDLQVSINDDEYYDFMFQDYKLVNIDLNQGTGGNSVFLWSKKDDCTCYPIKDVSVSVIPIVEAWEGWKVIQKSLNEGNTSPVKLFLCFRD